MSRPVEQPRDERGWRVPREGTLSRQIYERVVNGLSAPEVAVALDKSYRNIAVLVWRFKNPEDANRISARASRRARVRSPQELREAKLRLAAVRQAALLKRIEQLRGCPDHTIVVKRKGRDYNQSSRRQLKNDRVSYRRWERIKSELQVQA